MKNLFLVIALSAIFTLNACAQKNVPANVKTAFNQKFPTATNVKWGKENSKEWEAEFKMDNKEYSANYDNNGSWIETEYVITTNEIPEEVKTAIDKDYVGYNIALSEVSETVTGKVYEFELKKGTKKIEVAFDPYGKVINKDNEKD